LTLSCQGVSLHTLDLVKELMEKAKTRTGLRVTVNILDKIYQTGRQCTEVTAQVGVGEFGKVSI
jgi:S-adenosylmethionine:tRNA-ribosyltransferase-isomerase (queuine synthetase)